VWGVAGVDPAGSASEPLLPHERLDLGAAIAAHTIGAAHACAIEDVTGSIEQGKLAGLAPRDYLEARVLATLLEGEVVYAAGDTELSLSR
jgi:predicted amidohydrolase YtcJ